MKKYLALILVCALLLSMTACGGSSSQSVDLNALYSEYEKTLPTMIVLDDATMLNFLGIHAEDCTQAVTAICGDGLRTDEVWLIEAKDAAALERITQLANNRLSAKADETKCYNPDQYIVVEQAVLLTDGLYLALLVSPDVEALKASFEASFN